MTEKSFFKSNLKKTGIFLEKRLEKFLKMGYLI